MVGDARPGAGEAARVGTSHAPRPSDPADGVERRTVEDPICPVRVRPKQDQTLVDHRT